MPELTPGLRKRLTFSSRPAPAQGVSEIAERARLRLEQRAAGIRERRQVHSGETAAERSLQPAIQDRLDERRQRERITRGHEVDRPAHEHRPDRAASFD